jgi:ribonucleotide reductase class II
MLKLNSTSPLNSAPPLSAIQLASAYSRIKADGKLENWDEICDRYLHHPEAGLFAIGDYTEEEETLIEKMQRADGQVSNVKVFGSMRALWCVSDWAAQPGNYAAMFNCQSRNIDSIEAICSQAELAMLGVGTGCVLTQEHICKIPLVKQRISIELVGKPGDKTKAERQENTSIIWREDYSDTADEKYTDISVGDSREGWVEAYRAILNVAIVGDSPPHIKIYLGNIRSAGERVMGFGGTANPNELGKCFEMISLVLAGAVSRQLTSVELCLVIDWFSKAIQSGGIRRAAGMRQFDADDIEAAAAKTGLWQENENGEWKIDVMRAAMTAANHTRVFKRKPTYEECLESVNKQFKSGEGAIQWAGEAITRASADLLPQGSSERQRFLDLYSISEEKSMRWLMQIFKLSFVDAHNRMQRKALNPCGEAIFSDNFCNLASVHLGNIDPFNLEEQRQAFRVAALHASGLLNKNFIDPLFKASRDADPIVIVSFTEAIDYFTRAFGIPWLRWWKRDRASNAWEVVEGADRDRIETVSKLFGVNISDYEVETIPLEGYTERELRQPQRYLNLNIFTTLEEKYLTLWRMTVRKTVWGYCDQHDLKRPNRCTGLKPEGSGTLLTGIGCCGIHLPKAWWYIRRKECRAGDPKALAAIAFGYEVMPASSEKDEYGVLLNDPYDPRVNQWVIQVPCQEPLISTFPELEDLELDPSQFSAIAQLRWFKQVQKYYSEHNTSYTLELRENEIEAVAKGIYEAIRDDEDFISMALLARYHDRKTFPRLPFEPISRSEYERLTSEVLQRRKFDTYEEALSLFSDFIDSPPPSCDSAICEF